MSRLLLACLAVAIIMAAVVIAGGVVDRLDAAAAGAIAGIVLSAVTGALVGITGLVVGVRMGRGMNSYEPPGAPVRIYQPPQAQLPEPKIVTVPRFIVNGAAKPWPAVHLQTVVDDETLTVPLARLMVFLALATPARSEWSGDKAIYGQCAAFCMSHGLLDKTERGGYAWKDAYPIESRKQWSSQFDG